MFNLSGSEIVFLLIIGLVVLGPEKLPGALHKAGRIYGEFKRIATGAESDFRSAFSEPLRELQDTASSYKSMFTNAASEITKDVKASSSEVKPGENLEIKPESAPAIEQSRLAPKSENSDETIDGM